MEQFYYCDIKLLKNSIHSFIHSLPELTSPLWEHFTWLTPHGPYRVTTYRKRELTLDHIHTFLTRQGHGEPPRMRDQLNARDTYEITRTWKTKHTIRASIHSNKANMKEWLWRQNDIRGPCGPKASWHFVLQVRKKSRKKIYVCVCVCVNVYIQYIQYVFIVVFWRPWFLLIIGTFQANVYKKRKYFTRCSIQTSLISINYKTESMTDRAMKLQRIQENS